MNMTVQLQSSIIQSDVDVARLISASRRNRTQQRFLAEKLPAGP